MHKKMEAILSRVQKPARYVGGEWGSVTKDKAGVDLRFAFCFRIPMKLLCHIWVPVFCMDC